MAIITVSAKSVQAIILSLPRMASFSKQEASSTRELIRSKALRRADALLLQWRKNAEVQPVREHRAIVCRGSDVLCLDWFPRTLSCRTGRSDPSKTLKLMGQKRFT